MIALSVIGFSLIVDCFIQVSNHQITMHLDGDMTVVGNLTVSSHLSPLEINYVTSISSEDQSQEQIVHYCENVKYEAVPIKQEYHRLQDRLTAEEPQHILENNVSLILSYNNLIKERPINTLLLYNRIMVIITI